MNTTYGANNVKSGAELEVMSLIVSQGEQQSIERVMCVHS